MSVRFHTFGCWVDGGPGLPRGLCAKCADTADLRFVAALMRIDRKARALG